MTTFYRLQCLEFEEELEDHIECLKTYATNADEVCQHKCTTKSDKMEKKDETQKSLCKSVECSTYCYYREFSKTCPEAKDLLMVSMEQFP
uniref:Uncharacterized protein n=1 Tax=Acrobeloides nanus TaxID=290746 RepID=A0A914EPS5_9BILA